MHPGDLITFYFSYAARTNKWKTDESRPTILAGPSVGDSRFLVATGQNVAFYIDALKTLHPAGFKGWCKKSGFIFLVWSNIYRICPKIVLTWQSKDLPVPSDPVLMRYSNPADKMSLVVVNFKNRRVEKIASGSTRRKLQNEYFSLMGLQNYPEISVPEVIDYSDDERGYTKLSTAYLHEKKVSTELDDTKINILRALARIGHPYSATGKKLDPWLENIPKHPLTQKTLQPDYRLEEIDLGDPYLNLSHGDFAYWNVLSDHSMSVAIDWEGSEFRFALYDFFDYFFLPQAAVNKIEKATNPNDLFPLARRIYGDIFEVSTRTYQFYLTMYLKQKITEDRSTRTAFWKKIEEISQ